MWKAMAGGEAGGTERLGSEQLRVQLCYSCQEQWGNELGHPLHWDCSPASPLMCPACSLTRRCTKTFRLHSPPRPMPTRCAPSSRMRAF